MKFIFRNIIQLFFLLLISGFKFVFANGDEYVFNQLTIEDGLSQTTVLSITQDHKGYMWFGTAFGLNKYDGYSFTVYMSSLTDTTKLSDNRITCLFEDSEKNLWIGTIDGTLNRYNRETNTFSHFSFIDTIVLPYQIPDQYYEYPISFSRNDNHSITAIEEDLDGYLWIGTWGKGVFRFDKKNSSYIHFFTHPENKTGLSFNRITEILVDHSGEIWIGTFGGGINKVVKDGAGISFEQFKHSGSDLGSLSDDKVISVFQDSYKNIWIGTYYGGLNRISPEETGSGFKKSFKVFKNNPGDRSSLSNNTVMAITEDQEGGLWIGTFGGGLNKFNREHEDFTNFMNDPFNVNTIGDNDVLSLHCDRSGILWIGTHLGQGLNKLEKNKVKFSTIKHIPGSTSGLNDEVVWSIFQDRQKIFWFGTYKGGVNRFDRSTNKFRYFRPGQNSVSDGHNRSLAEDNFGNLWIGNYSGGLNRYNFASEKFTYFKHDPGDDKTIGANQIQDILIDSNNVMWLGTFGGGLNFVQLSGEANSQLIFHSLKNKPGDPTSISDNRVYSLCEGRDAALWVGTFGGGLNKFDKSSRKFLRYVHNPQDDSSLSSNRVMTVFEDTDGIIWVGTYGGGLNKLNPESGYFKRYSDKEGLIGGVVYGILEDRNKNLWMSTNSGIFKFNKTTELFTQYDLQDGLQSLEFSGGAYFETDDGEMFFGGISGINHFYPDSITENQNIPPIVITNVRVFNNPIEGERESIELSYDKNFLTFEFAALDYTNPGANQYSYMLEGLDKEWRFTNSSIRIANYTNLSPGQYTFRVKGSNNDGVWNEEGTMIRIIINPPVWKTWWFLLAAIVISALVIYYISTIRIKNLLAIEKLKTKLAADLHDNIGSGLTEISILSELVVNDISADKSNASQKLRSISDTARQLVDNMSDIVWVVNPKRDSLHDLIIRLKDTYSEILRLKGVSFKTSNLEKLSNIKLPMEYRQNLFLIFKEAINNSIKHSQCKNLMLEANVHGDAIEMTLDDDGVGMNEINMMVGNGIKNIESRARSIGGRIKWKTAPGSGTKIKFIGYSNRKNFIKNIFSLNS
ncbi:MAG: hypothetical protein IPM56_14315 [Ignavibacteriales bacterium]|nr:MAG: hypothetical protein IPM56_14315 [Ignavibacteriales bacterium]